MLLILKFILPEKYLKMKYTSYLLISSLLLLVACTKDKSKTCTYYKKPLPVNVKFVNYHDYEITNFDVYQYDQNSNFQSLVKVDEVRHNEMVPVNHDTSDVLFKLGNKVDYMIVLTQLSDTFYISKINYENDYFEVIEPSGKCDQQKEYVQLPDSAQVNGNFTTFEKLTAETATLYLKK